MSNLLIRTNNKENENEIRDKKKFKSIKKVNIDYITKLFKNNEKDLILIIKN